MWVGIVFRFGFGFGLALALVLVADGTRGGSGFDHERKRSKNEKRNVNHSCPTTWVKHASDKAFKTKRLAVHRNKVRKNGEVMTTSKKKDAT